MMVQKYQRSKAAKDDFCQDLEKNLFLWLGEKI